MKLGRRQRLMLTTLADRGVWAVGCGWGVASGRNNAQRTREVLEAMRKRGLVEEFTWTPASGSRHEPARRVAWKLTGHGYQWLIDQVKADREQVDAPPADLPGEMRPTTWDTLTTRIDHLATLSHLGRVYPVNWRGERV